MPERRAPSARTRQLAVQLRLLREESNLTGAEVATRLKWSAAKVSRLETGATAVTSGDLRRLLNLYQVSGPVRRRLTQLNIDTNKRGWLDAYADEMNEEYSRLIVLEEVAESERQYSPIIVPGLLQTGRFAQEVTRASLQHRPPNVIDELAQARMKRQEVLDGDNPLKLHVVIEEGALRRQIHGPEVMFEQLSHLTQMSQRDNITLQVLPYTAGAHLALASSGAFTIVRFLAVKESEVVYLQNMTSDLFIEKREDVWKYSEAFDNLRDIALDEAKSLSFIDGIAREIRLK